MTTCQPAMSPERRCVMAKFSNSEARLKVLAADLKECLKADVRNVYTMGAILTEANRVLEHGNWGPWLDDFGISEKSSRNYMAAHKFKLAISQMAAFKSVKFTDLKLRPSAVYLLAEMLETKVFQNDEGMVAVEIEDIGAVLTAAKDAWVGPKVLAAIMHERHPTSFAPPADESVGDAGTDTMPDDTGEAGELDDKPLKPPASIPELSKRVTDLLSFTSWVEGLWGLREQPASTFRTTSIKLEQIERVIELLTDVAKLLTPTVVPLRTAGSVEIPVADVKAAHEATELEPV